MRGLALASAWLLLALAPTAQDPPPVFRTGVATVTVDVSVRSASGPVTDLTAADFLVTDNGVPQEVLDVSRERLPLDVTFLLDVSGSVQGRLREALARGVAGASARLGPADRARLVTFNQRVREAVALSPPNAVAAAATRLETAGHTALLDALVLSLVSVPEPGRRQMAIVFTDGADTTSLTDEAAVRDVARRTQPALFFVVVTEGAVRSAPHRELFTALATATGGSVQVLRPTQDVSDSFIAALDEFRLGYVLHYAVKGVAREGWHDIDVRITRPGEYVVRARKGYFGGQP